MSTANQALIRRLFEEVVTQGNLAVIEAIYASNVVDLNASRGHSGGRANIYRVLAELHTILLQLHIVVDEVRADVDTVMTRETWSGTHAYTGKHVKGTVTHIFRITDGQIIEEWSGGWEWLDQLSCCT